METGLNPLEGRFRGRIPSNSEPVPGSGARIRFGAILRTSWPFRNDP